ncbi:MAG: hypothetical protein ACJ8A6_06425 [Gemmatimonadales bacterium]
MPLRDYAALDEDDFYGQGFELPGVVSVWLGTEPPGKVDPNLDVLQDLCGVGYYSLDSNEVNVLNAASPLEAMLGPLSYSKSFLPAVLKAAAKRGITACWWAVAQYDFKYDRKRVKRSIAPQPVFLGVFKYVAEDEPPESPG